MTTTLDSALVRTAEELTARGLPTRHYVVRDCDGYRPVTGIAADVHCLDVRLGPALRHPGRSTHCLFQVFDPAHPNLGLSLCHDREDSDGAPVDNHVLPRIGPALDLVITNTLTPALNSALAPLDPTGRGRSVVVGCWHGRPTLVDLALIPVTATKLLRRFRSQGQAALVWADFQAPLAESLSRLAGRLIGARDAHLLPRTGAPSAIRVPVRDDRGRDAALSDFSDALDKGIRLARRHLS
ncbi:hypothetical protein GCM10022247_34020 [Allokutzneria multivorans]|uniref:Uncharacterized protein n=1 Tax=Allokutzneria multivorans TaxID=1142134 RepID=A0ABP7SAN0_9PSEU